MKKQSAKLLWAFISATAIALLMIWVISIQTKHQNEQIYYMEADSTIISIK